MNLKTSKTKEPTPMSLEEFYQMIDESLLDAKEGRVISHEDLKKEIRTWHLKYTGQR